MIGLPSQNQKTTVWLHIGAEIYSEKLYNNKKFGFFCFLADGFHLTQGCRGVLNKITIVLTSFYISGIAVDRYS